MVKIKRILFLVSISLVCILCDLVRTQSCREDENTVRQCEALCVSKGVCELRAALILPLNTASEASLPRVRPVFELAEQDIRAAGLIPEWLKFSLTPYDDRCDAAYALVSAIDAYTDHCAHVYFGPSCDYAIAAVGRLTKFLGNTGTPLLTVGGLTFDFSNPKTDCSHEFYMLTRAGTVGFQDIALFLVELMKDFHWSQTALVSEKDGQYSAAGSDSCFLMMKTMAGLLKENNFEYNYYDTSQNKMKGYTENMADLVQKKYTSSFDWQQTVLLYESASHYRTAGLNSGFLMASTINEFLTDSSVNVEAREVFDGDAEYYIEILKDTPGIQDSSEFDVVLSGVA